MPRTVRVTLDNGDTVQFDNVPDNVTPDQIAARAQQETGASAVTIDGGAKSSAPKAAAPAPEEEVGGPPESDFVPVDAPPDVPGFEKEIESYYRSLDGKPPEATTVADLAAKYRVGAVSNFPEILSFYEQYGTLNPKVYQQGEDGTPPLPPKPEEIVTTVDPASNFGQRARAFGKGLLFDFADELEAATRMVASGELSTDEYYRIKNQINADYNAWAKANPEEALGIELAGGLAGAFIPGVGLVGKGYQAATGLGRLSNVGLRAAATGAGSGAVSGLGQAETLAVGNVLPSVIEQGMIGGVTGGVLGSATSAIGKRFIPKSQSALPEEQRAAEIIYGATEGGLSPERAAGSARLAERYGVPVPYGMASPELSALTEKVLAKPSAGRRGLAATLAETQAEAAERVGEQARRAMPGVPDYFDAQGAITNRLRQIGDQDYKVAYGVGDIRDATVDSVIKNPELASVWREAQSLARLKGRDLNMRMEPVFDEGGSLVGLAPTQDAIPNVEAIDYFKRALDDQIDAGFRGKSSGGKSRAAALRDLRNKLVTRVDELVPEYRAARSKYAGDLEVRDALDFGREMLSKRFRPKEVEARLAKMSVAEREAAKSGALQALMEPLEDATRRGNVAQQIIGAGGKGSAKLAKLKAVMDPAEFKFYERALRKESELYNMASRATGGSRTVPLAQGIAEIDNLIAGGDIDKAVNFILAGPQGRMAALARWVGNLRPNKEFGDKVYTQLSRALSAQSPEQLRDVLDMLRRSNSYARAALAVEDAAVNRAAVAAGNVGPSPLEDRGTNPPPALSTGDDEGDGLSNEISDVLDKAQAAVDAPIAGEEGAENLGEADILAQSDGQLIDASTGRPMLFDPTSGQHFYTDTDEPVGYKSGGAVKGYNRGGALDFLPDAEDVKGFGRSVAEGALYGYNDELEALLRAGFDKKARQRVLDDIRREQIKYEEDHGGYAALGNVLGSVGTAFVPGMQGLSAARVAQMGPKARAAYELALGAAQGAAYGSGKMYDDPDSKRDPLAVLVSETAGGALGYPASRAAVAGGRALGRRVPQGAKDFVARKGRELAGSLRVRRPIRR